MAEAHAERTRGPTHPRHTLRLRNGLTASRAIGAYAAGPVGRHRLHGRDGELVRVGPGRADVEAAGAAHAEAGIPAITRAEIDADGGEPPDVRLQSIEGVRNRNRARVRIAIHGLAEVAAGV